MRSVAIKIGIDATNAKEPGYVYEDGSFTYLPIPESDPTVKRPTYAELDVPESLIDQFGETVLTMNPEFPSMPTGERATYAVTTPVETGILTELTEGDLIFFYSKLQYGDNGKPKLAAINQDSGYYIIAQMQLARDPVIIKDRWNISRDIWTAFSTNAVRRRQRFHALGLILGDTTTSGLYDAVLPITDTAIENECLKNSNVRAKPNGNHPPIFLDESDTDRLLRQSSGGRVRMPYLH